jgi:hypothetical protein
MRYYDVTFVQINGRRVVKKQIPSEKKGYDVWQDAALKFDDSEICVLMDDGLFINFNRRMLVSITAKEVEPQSDQAKKFHDEIVGAVNTLSNMGF